MDNFDDYDEDTITLIAGDGTEIEFVEIAGIILEDTQYAILQPIELLEGMSEDEALVFKVTENEDGEEGFEIVTDEETINAVFDEYQKIVDEYDLDEDDDSDDDE